MRCNGKTIPISTYEQGSSGRLHQDELVLGSFVTARLAIVSGGDSAYDLAAEFPVKPTNLTLSPAQLSADLLELCFVDQDLQPVFSVPLQMWDGLIIPPIDNIRVIVASTHGQHEPVEGYLLMHHIDASLERLTTQTTLPAPVPHRPKELIKV